MRPFFTFFDLDDTLVETRKAITNRLRICIRQYNPDMTLEGIYSLLGNPGRVDALRMVCRSAEDFWKSYEEFRKTIHASVVDGAKDKLEELSMAGIPLGIITNNFREKVLEKLSYARLETKIFPLGIYGYDTLQAKKPSKDIYSKIGIDPSKCLYIGDSLEDYEFTRNSGSNFIAVCTGEYNSENFLAAGVQREKVLNSIKELEAVKCFF